MSLSSSAAARPVRRRAAWREKFVPMAGNFAIQYNYNALNVVTMILEEVHAPYGPEGTVVQPKWAQVVLQSTVFAGSTVGMLVMGYLGDLIGRRRAMQVTQLVVVLSALVSAVGTFGSAQAVYTTMAVARFFMGVGVGGIYPLSAAMSSEQGEEHGDYDPDRSRRVAQAYFFQTPGVIAPYVVGGVFVALGPGLGRSAAAHLALGVGLLPSVLCLLDSMSTTEPEEFEAARVANVSAESASPFRRVMQHREYWGTIFAASATWFLFDITFYCLTAFTSPMMQQMFPNLDLNQNMWVSSAYQTAAIPGIGLALWAVRSWGCKRLNFYGFLTNTVSFALVGVSIMYNWPTAAKFPLILLASASVNFGPNLAVFVFPALALPAVIRSSCHGFASMMGKLGAVTGTLVFRPVQDAFGDERTGLAVLFYLMAGVSLLGAVVTQLSMKHDWEYGEEALVVQSPRADGSMVQAADLQRASRSMIELELEMEAAHFQ